MVDANLRTNGWPVPALCRRCHAQILICPVIDSSSMEDFLMPLIVDSWPDHNQWASRNDGTGYWEQTLAYKPHECKEEAVAAVRAAEETEADAIGAESGVEHEEL